MSVSRSAAHAHRQGARPGLHHWEEEDGRPVWQHNRRTLQGTEGWNSSTGWLWILLIYQAWSQKTKQLFHLYVSYTCLPPHPTLSSDWSDVVFAGPSIWWRSVGQLPPTWVYLKRHSSRPSSTHRWGYTHSYAHISSLDPWQHFWLNLAFILLISLNQHCIWGFRCFAYQVVDGFFVKRVQDVRESAAYLTIMTRHLTRLYQVKRRFVSFRVQKFCLFNYPHRLKPVGLVNASVDVDLIPWHNAGPQTHLLICAFRTVRSRVAPESWRGMERAMRWRRGTPPALSFLSRSSTMVLSKTRCVYSAHSFTSIHSPALATVRKIFSAPVSDSEGSVCQTVDADQRFVWRQGSCHTGALQHSSQVTRATSHTRTFHRRVLHNTSLFVLTSVLQKLQVFCTRLQRNISCRKDVMLSKDGYHGAEKPVSSYRRETGDRSWMLHRTWVGMSQWPSLYLHSWPFSFSRPQSSDSLRTVQQWGRQRETALLHPIRKTQKVCANKFSDTTARRGGGGSGHRETMGIVNHQNYTH